MGQEQVLQDISYGMYIISTKYDNINAGCVVNALTQVTSDSKLIAVNINKNNFTNKIIKKRKEFAISILSKNISPNLIKNFGYFSSKDKNKFENIEKININNIPVVTEKITGYLICKVINIINCNTHDIIIGKIENMKKISDDDPMTYKYYREVLKGKSPKNAPTYETEISKGKENKYRCKICGYVYDDEEEKIKFEELPEEWKCPHCQVSKSMFDKL